MLKGIKEWFFGEEEELEDFLVEEVVEDVDNSEKLARLRKELREQIGVKGLKGRMALVLDYSGSIRTQYKDGGLQGFLDILMPIGIELGQGEIDVWLSTHKCMRLEPMTEENHSTYEGRIIKKSGMCLGGTEYVPVIRDIMEKYYKEEKESGPVYVIHVTNGLNGDEGRTSELVKESRKERIYFQYLGVGETYLSGTNRFAYLEHLGDLELRGVDNTDFQRQESLKGLCAKDLYTRLVGEYLRWVEKRGFIEEEK